MNRTRKSLQRSLDKAGSTNHLNNNDKENNKKKLVSGKCAKPKECDIQIVVKYPNEKLDPKHTKDRSFDLLDFNMLITVELEIINWEGITQVEQSACIEVTCTLCYHKKYLSDGYLGEGYEAIMNQIQKEN